MTFDTPCFCYICGDKFFTIDMIGCIMQQQEAAIRCKEKKIISQDERGYIGICGDCEKYAPRPHIRNIKEKYGYIALEKKDNILPKNWKSGNSSSKVGTGHNIKAELPAKEVSA